MRKSLLSLLVLLFCFGPAWGQGTGLNLYGGGGISVPMGDLKGFWESGYSGTIGVGLGLIPTLETVARFSVHTFPLDDDKYGGVDFTVHEYGLDIRANLSAPGRPFRPYALIGVGMAKYDFSEKMIDDAVADGVSSSLEKLEPKTKFFYNIGGGFKVRAMPKLNFFLEGRYTKIQVPHGKIDYFPITIGLNISL